MALDRAEALKDEKVTENCKQLQNDVTVSYGKQAWGEVVKGTLSSREVQAKINVRRQALDTIRTQTQDLCTICTQTQVSLPRPSSFYSNPLPNVSNQMRYFYRQFVSGLYSRLPTTNGITATL